ncbi:MAG TPA: hypothetical protein VFF06_24845 [Polyangia bacterium]|nr:hypothetical protein [Polyangia bacterium]
MIALTLWFALSAYAVPAGAAAASTITLTVQSSSSEGRWSCIVDLWIDAKVARGADTDEVTVTVHAPHARMEAAASSPEKFRAEIAAESPAQQQAISLLDGKSVSFAVNRKTGALAGGAPRFDADVSFAGVDAAFWFALAWLAPLPAESGPRRVTRATAWGVPWKLAGDATLDAGSYLIPSGTLEGDLTVGRAAGAVKRHLTIALAPRR